MISFATLKKTRLIGDAFWAVAGQIASAMALLAGTRILTELVAPDVYGQVALLSGFVALGVAVFSYPYICAGMRILPECQCIADRQDLFKQVYRLTFRSVAFAIAFLMLGGAVYSYMTQSSIVLFVLSGVLLAVTVRRELGIQLLIGERRHQAASVWQTCDSLLRPLLAISMIWLVGENAEWLLSGYILATLSSNILGFFFQAAGSGEIKTHLPNTGRHFRQEVWAYALPLIPMELIFWINGLGDRYVIGYFMTAADVGIYAASYTIINEAFNRAAMLLLRIFQPVYFQLFSEKQAEKGFVILWAWIGCVLALGIFGVTALYFTKDWLAALLLAKSYQSAVELMPAIAIGCALHALGSVLAQPLLAEKRTRLVLVGRISGVVTAAIAIPLLVKNYGLQGAAFANPIYFGVEAFVLALLAKPWQVFGAEHRLSMDEAASCKASI